LVTLQIENLNGKIYEWLNEIKDVI
jgi:hypothetical protein